MSSKTFLLFQRKEANGMNCGRGGLRSFFGHKLLHGGSTLLFSLAFFVIGYHTVIAGTSGKIVGKVVTKVSGEALPGTNVTVVGTALGAAADGKGEFIILNVPPGTYDLEASMIGYAKLKITRVRVGIDRTSEVDFKLSEAAIVTGEVVVVANRTLVQKDVSATQVSISSEEVEEIPVARLEHVLGFQAGLEYQVSETTSQGKTTGNSGRGFSIRGGMLDESTIVLDGYSLQNRHLNQPYLGINKSAIKEVQVQTGGFNAEYGNVRSGLIHVVSKEGNPDRYTLSGDIRINPPQRKHFGGDLNDANSVEWRTFAGKYAQDGVPQELWGSKEFPIMFVENNGVFTPTTKTAEEGAVGWPGWANHRSSGANNRYNESSLTPESKQELWEWRHRPISYADNPDFDIDLGIGGPVPLIGNRSTFFLSGRTKRSHYMYPTGDDPYYQDQNYQLRMALPLNSNMKLSLTGLFGRVDAHTQGSNTGQFSIQTGDTQFEDNPWQVFHSIYDKGAFLPIRRDIYVAGAEFQHFLNPRTFYEFKFAYKRSKNDQDYLPTKNAQLREDYRPPDWVDPTPVFFLETQEDRTLGREPSFPVYDWQNGHNLWYTRDQTGLHQIQGRGRFRDLSENTTILVSGAITKQMGKYNLVKAGVNLNFIHEDYHVFRGTEHWHLWKPERSNYRNRVFDEHPREFSAYVQDKIEFEGLIVNAGVRLDVYDPNTKWYNFLDGNRFGPEYTGKTLWEVDKTQLIVDWYKDEQVQALRTVDIDAKVRVSPRLGVSHPISDRAKVYFNFGTFYQPPTFEEMYLQWIGHNQNSLTLGNPDLEPRKTVAYEVGYQFGFMGSTMLQIAGYYKNVTNEVETVDFESPFSGADYTTYDNKLYRDLRGLELNVRQWIGSNLNVWLNWNFVQISEGRRGFTKVSESETAQREIALEESADQFRPFAQPSFRLNLAYYTPKDFGPSFLGGKPLGNMRLSVVHFRRSGGKFRWPEKVDGRTVFVEQRGFRNTNLYLEKTLPRMGWINPTFYVQVDNLLNVKTVNTEAILFDRSEGGRGQPYRDSLNLPFTDPPGNDKYGDYEGKTLFWADWIKFRNPRQFYFGFKLGFN
ncbi:MAG: TonB-dependent receptor domain-containing protein [bacterium]